MGLKAGISRVNITPPPGCFLAGYRLREKPAWNIQDELWAHALLLEQGSRRSVLVTADLLYMPLNRIQCMRRQIESLTGLPPESVMITCTHTHSAPFTSEGVHMVLQDEKEPTPLTNESYLQVLQEKLIGAVVNAADRSEPAQLSFGAGELLAATINRRNPKGPIDSTVSVLRVKPHSDAWSALLINFACHPTSMGPREKAPVVSPDYPGHLARYIERVQGSGVHVMFANGATGNIDPWNFYFMGDDLAQGDIRHVYTHQYTLEHSLKLGQLVALEALKASMIAQNIEAQPIGFALEPLNLPVRPWPSEQEAVQELERCRQVLERTKKGEVIKPAEKTREDLLYERQIACFYSDFPVEKWGPVIGEKYAEEIIRFVRERDENPDKQTIRTQVQAFSWGDLAMVGIPGELFVEIGQQIKSGSPFPHTLVFGYTNDFVGYLPTKEAFPEGGYGVTWTSRVTEEAAGLILKAADNALQTCRNQSV